MRVRAVLQDKFCLILVYFIFILRLHKYFFSEVKISSLFTSEIFFNQFTINTSEICDCIRQVFANINEIPDTMTTQTIKISVVFNIHDFNFSDERGNSLGLNYDTIPDTAWYVCTFWTTSGAEDSICLNWARVSGPPADSIFVDTNLTPFLDTSEVHVLNGSVTVLPIALCGDSNSDGVVNLLDILFLIGWLYKGGPSPNPPIIGDVDGSGASDDAMIYFWISDPDTAGTYNMLCIDDDNDLTEATETDKTPKLFLREYDAVFECTEEKYNNESDVELWLLVEDVVVNNEFTLLETLAERIARAIIKNFDIESIRLRVRKPRVPIRGNLDYVEVEIERGKEGISIS